MKHESHSMPSSLPSSTTSSARERILKAGSILAAACALPGVAGAEGAPTNGVVGFKYLFYKDLQAGLDRITVNSPSAFVLLPLGSNWSIESSVVVDTLSGPSPRYHTSVSSASKMSDDRTAADFKVTRYFRRAALSVGIARSSENDYESNARSVDLRMATDDNNTTFTIGFGGSNDRIQPTNGGAQGITSDKKNTFDYILGITHVLTPTDIVKLNRTSSTSKGYLNDPYKSLDFRPRTRDQTAWLAQWNHHFEGMHGTLRSSYRYYDDTFKVKAHTFGLEYAQELDGGWVVTPAVRYHSQSAAFFYYDPVYDPVGGAPFPPGYLASPWRYSSADQRLSAFGGVTVGAKIEKTFGLWTTDLRYDYLQQRGEWRMSGQGSPGLEPFMAHFIQFGVARKF